MQNIEVKCDVFKFSSHEYMNEASIINLVYNGDGKEYSYKRGIPNDLETDFDFNLIYEYK